MRPVAGTRGEEQAEPWGEGGWSTPAFLSAALLSEAFFFSPLVLQHFFVLSRAVSRWNSFHTN